MAFTASAVTVTTTATLLSSAASGQLDIRPTNGDIYIGPADVTSATGMLLKQDEIYTGTMNGAESDAVYGITASGSVSVRVLVNAR